MTKFNYPYRHLLQMIIEASAPLRVGNGEKGIKTDSLVIRDVNGLPFIPGATLAGLLSHALKEQWGKEKAENLMGSQKEGSRLVITEAKLLDRSGNPIDGLVDFSECSEEDKRFLDIYERLPIRQHVRIEHRGSAKKGGKFDEEVVLKGSRFCFEVELLAKTAEHETVNALLAILCSPFFRIGSGSRSGFGEIKVVQCRQKVLDLNEPKDCGLYLDKSSRIGSEWTGWEEAVPAERAVPQPWTRYRLNLQPEDFILFGSGFANSDADMTYVREAHIDWSSGTGELIKQENTVLIPASSVKGALSHRTAFHYNRLTEAVLLPDGKLKKEQTIETVTGNKNIAVKAIFGSEGEKNRTSNKMEDKSRGNILISDVIQVKGETSIQKVLNHVSIDSFTGGAIDGALFQEQVLYAKEETFQINLMLADTAIVDSDIRKAFEAALKDVVSGMLPLGGGVNRGNGIFTGSVEIFNKEKEQWEKLA